MNNLKALLGLAATVFSTNVQSQEPCFSPACGPAVSSQELCLPQGCSPVVYYRVENFSVAVAVVPGTKLPSNGACVGPGPCSNTTEGFKVMGWSGPCPSDDFSMCPDLLTQSFENMRTNALRVNRSYKAAGITN